MDAAGIVREQMVAIECHRFIIAAMRKGIERNDPDDFELIAHGAGALCAMAENSAWECRVPFHCVWLLTPPAAAHVRSVTANREIGRYGGVKVLVFALTDLRMPLEAHQQCVWLLNQMCRVGAFGWTCARAMCLCGCRV